MIKLFCNQGFFNKFISNKCLYCDNENSLEHIVDECNNIIYVNLRKKYKLIIRNRIGNKFYDKYNKEGLLKMIKLLYFNPIKFKNINISLDIIKSFAYELIAERKEKEDELLKN